MEDFDITQFRELILDEGAIFCGRTDSGIEHYMGINGLRVTIDTNEPFVTPDTAAGWLVDLGLEDVIGRLGYD